MKARSVLGVILAALIPLVLFIGTPRASASAKSFAEFSRSALAVGSGIITTQNLNPNTGTATPGSFVNLGFLPPGPIIVLHDILGTYTASGGLTCQVSMDGGTTWKNISSSTALTSNAGAQTATIPSGGVSQYVLSIAGGGSYRLSANGAVTGTAQVQMAAGIGGPASLGLGGGGGSTGGGGNVTIVGPLDAQNDVAIGLSSVGGTAFGLGRGTAANSLSVALASDNGNVPVSVNAFTAALPAGSNTIGNISNISGTISLPTGAATSALQTTGNTALTTINTTLGSPYQAGGAMAITSALPAGTNSIGAVTGQATGSAAPAGAFYQGGIATTAIPTVATAGNLTGLMVDTLGRLVTSPQAPRILVKTQNTTITSSTGATEVITAPASGVFADVTSIVFVNSSSTGTVLTLSDGTANYSFYCPPTDMRGVAYQVPLAETTAATHWTVACTTSVASVIVTVSWVTTK